MQIPCCEIESSEKYPILYNSFEGCRNNSKQIWDTVSGLLGRSNSTSPFHVEHINAPNESLVCEIDKKIMKGKYCTLVLQDILLDAIEKMLISLPDNRSPGYNLIVNKLVIYS